MNQEDRKKLAAAAIPLEVLCGQIRVKPYKELTEELQTQLLESLDVIRNLLFSEKANEAVQP